MDNGGVSSQPRKLVSPVCVIFFIIFMNYLIEKLEGGLTKSNSFDTLFYYIYGELRKSLDSHKT